MNNDLGVVKISKFDVNDAMEEICLKYKIQQTDISLFLPIYYPVAIVKIFMQEKILDDIDQIPLTMLRFVSVGISDENAISNLTGLSVDYVAAMLNIQRTYGQINEEGWLTEYGKESIAERKNIQLKSVEQSFQIDTLTGGIINQKQIVKETELYSDGETTEQMIHIFGLPGIDEKYVKDEIIKGDPKLYLDNRGSSLHTNVETIDRIEFSELKYARAYLMELKSHSGKPLVFSVRMDKTSHELGEIFTYQPYFAWSVDQVKECGLEEYTISISRNKDAKKSIKLLTKLVSERSNLLMEKVDCLDILRKIIVYFFPLDFPKEELEVSEGYLCILNIRSHMIVRCNGAIIHLLWLLSNYGAAYLANERTYGRLIKIETKDDRVEQLVSLYKALCSKQSRKDIKARILNEFGAYSGDNLVEDMIKLLSIG